jgi:ubiquinone/menaquinone biosynthesis C-methylase UbiE
MAAPALSGASRVAGILDGLALEADGIYSSTLPATPQADEIRARAAVARGEYADVMAEISRHHSVPVMDAEIRLFLRGVGPHAVVVDVGAGWGWHWRRLDAMRTDVFVLVVDFVRENLRRAADLLGSLVNDRVFLVHADATALPFPASAFDGYWTVQTLQHIPAFERALEEAERVLRPNGLFACYALNRARLIELVYRLSGKQYHVRGTRAGSFYLARGSAEERRVVERVFGSRVTSRYTELLFHPELRLCTGAQNSWAGAVDAKLSGALPPMSWVARQRSYHVRKPAVTRGDGALRG